MKKLAFTIENYLAAHAQLAAKLDEASFLKGVELIKSAYESGRKVITCGNGGSASTASHFITDWNKMANLSSGKKFRGISLCDNMGMLTAYANDLSYESVFCGQLRALMDEGDLVIGISGSGNSPNVLRAIEYANENGAQTMAVVGYDGGQLKKIAQHSVWVPSFDMQLCEDMHLMFGHMVMKTICKYDIST